MHIQIGDFEPIVSEVVFFRFQDVLAIEDFLLILQWLVKQESLDRYSRVVYPGIKTTKTFGRFVRCSSYIFKLTTSPGIATASPPVAFISSTIWLSACSLRALSTTRGPRLAATRAVTSPIPDEAPVITIT